MPVELNWGLASQQPNFANGFLQSYDAGRTMGRQQRADNAFAMLQANPNDPKAQQEAAVYNPQAYNAFAQQQAMQRQAQARSAAGNVIRSYGGVGGAMGAPQAPQAPTAAPQEAMPAYGGVPAPAQAPGAPAAPQQQLGALDPSHPVTQSVGAAVSSGQMNPTEAIARLYEADPEMGDKMMVAVKNMDDLRRSKLAESSEALASAAFHLKSVPPEQRMQAAMQMMPQLTAHGVTPQMIQNADLSDNGLNGIIGQSLGVKGLLEQANKDRELTETSRHNQVEEHKGVVQTVTNADSTTTTRLTDPVTGQEIGSGASGAGGGAPGGGTGGGAGARSVRNNNPGNLRASGFTQGQPGYKGADSAGYAIFSSPEQGAAAQAALLGGRGYFGGGRTNVQSIIEKWAPRASKGGDNTDAQVNNYIGYVAKQMGVSPTQPLTREQLPQMAAAMARFESGATGKAGSVRVSGGSAPSGGGSTLTGNSGGGTGGLSQQGVDLAAIEFLKTGKMPSNMGRSGAAGRAVVDRAAAMAQEQGQSLDDIVAGRVQFKAMSAQQVAATKDFGTGKNGNTVRSLNVAIDHLGQLSGAATALQNGNVQLFNRIGNSIAESTGKTAPTNFHALRDFVLDEVTKAIVGSGGGVGDREKAQSIISSAQSPEQLTGAIHTVKGLMAGQLHGLQLQYEQTTGQKDFGRFLSPQTARELGTHPSGKAPPSQGAVVRGFKFKGGDPAQPSSWEKVQ